MLRIFFIAEARYEGDFPYDEVMKRHHDQMQIDPIFFPVVIPFPPANYVGSWTGRVAWAGKIKPADRQKLLEHLKLPDSTGPAEWWLTEFEDDWPYKLAPEDVYFRRAKTQEPLKRARSTRLQHLPGRPTPRPTLSLPPWLCPVSFHDCGAGGENKPLPTLHGDCWLPPSALHKNCRVALPTTRRGKVGGAHPTYLPSAVPGICASSWQDGKVGGDAMGCAGVWVFASPSQTTCQMFGNS